MIVRNTKCHSKEQLITLLKNWLQTNEPTIGNGKNKTGNTKWIFLYLNDKEYYINGDTTREGIMNFVKNHEKNYPWVVIANNRNVYKKVSNEINENAIKGLYFYSNTIGEREF
jgi:Zn-dependent metalloprotease